MGRPAFAGDTAQAGCECARRLQSRFYKSLNRRGLKSQGGLRQRLHRHKRLNDCGG